jgi:glucose/arabinose dehydrogenase
VQQATRSRNFSGRPLVFARMRISATPRPAPWTATVVWPLLACVVLLLVPAAAGAHAGVVHHVSPTKVLAAGALRLVPLASYPESHAQYATLNGGRLWAAVDSRILVDGQVLGELDGIPMSFAISGQTVYVFLNDALGIRVVEYAIEGAGLVKRRTLLNVDLRPNPWTHMGGTVQVGPDRALYASVGDGDDGAGPADLHAQDAKDPRGKIWRIALADGTKRVVGLGLRNPFRFWIGGSHLYVGDVGQDSFEEITRVRLPRTRPANFGWPYYEGTRRFSKTRKRTCRACRARPPRGLSMPAIVHKHNYRVAYAGFCSVTTGYRDARLGFLYGDYCSGRIQRSTRWPATRDTGLRLPGLVSVTAGGVLTTVTGEVYRLELAR